VFAYEIDNLVRDASSVVPFLRLVDRPAEDNSFQWYCQSPLDPVDPSFRALSKRLKFTVRRHTFNQDSRFFQGWSLRSALVLSAAVSLLLKTTGPYFFRILVYLVIWLWVGVP